MSENVRMSGEESEQLATPRRPQQKLASISVPGLIFAPTMDAFVCPSDARQPVISQLVYEME
jgi:hypothetical protein